MSRTDRHRPVPVQLADPAEQNKAHRGTAELHLLHNTCACPEVCSAWRRPARRKARRSGERELRAAIRDALEQ